jgi:hypothetical protein
VAAGVEEPEVGQLRAAGLEDLGRQDEARESGAGPDEDVGLEREEPRQLLRLRGARRGAREVDEHQGADDALHGEETSGLRKTNRW